MAKTQHPIGPTYKAYSRKGQVAVNFLLRKRAGAVPNAIYNRGTGWIDVIWGYEGTGASDGYGLAKIAKFHPETVRKMAKIIAGMDVVSKTANRYKLESDKYSAAVSRLWFEEKKTWLLTVFEKKTR